MLQPSVRFATWLFDDAHMGDGCLGGPGCFPSLQAQRREGMMKSLVGLQTHWEVSA